MCNPASMVVTKHNVLWSKRTDSHERIIEEYNLYEINAHSEPTYVRIEISPEGNDFRRPLHQWKFETEQDMLPAWYDAKDVEQRVRAVLPAWLKSKVVLPDQIAHAVTGRLLAVYGIVLDLFDGGFVRNVCKGGRVRHVYDTGTVWNVFDGGEVRDVFEGGLVQNVASGGLVRNVLRNGIVKNVFDGAVLCVHDEGLVLNVTEAGSVHEVLSGGVVIAYNKLNPRILNGANAVLIDKSGDSVVVHTGIQTRSS